jgi:hypothetical protein
MRGPVFETAPEKRGLLSPSGIVIDFRNQNSKGLDLSKRREDKIGKKWLGAEAVYEAEGVGSRQWRVDSDSGACPVTRADRQLRC